MKHTKLICAFAAMTILLLQGFGSCKKSNNSPALAAYSKITPAGTDSLSQARAGLGAASAGSKIVFAGGVNANDAVSRTVDIYNVSTGLWITAQLSEARFDLAAAALANIMLVAGGGGTGKGTGYSKTVDALTFSN